MLRDVRADEILRRWANKYRLCQRSGDIFRVKPSKVVIHIIVSARKITMRIVLGVHHHPDTHLFEIAEALRSLGLFFGPRQRRQEHRSEDGNNRDDHQQLNQGKAVSSETSPAEDRARGLPSIIGFHSNKSSPFAIESG